MILASIVMLSFNYYFDDPWLGFHPATSHLLQRPREILSAARSWGEKSPRFGSGAVPTHAGGIGIPGFTNVASIVGLMASPQALQTPIAFMWNWRVGSAERVKMFYRQSVHRYQIFTSFRPWWAGQWHLPEEDRPVDIARTLVLLGLLSVLGLGLMLVAGRRSAG